MAFDLNKLLRDNIRNLVPYSSARDEYTGKDAVFLDANENPYETGLNRYPDPLQRELKELISGLKLVSPSNIFLGNGSDEPIDLLFRAFCTPGKDNVVAIKPTYGMYKVCADVNNVEYIESLLTSDYQIDVADLLAKVNDATKLVFICSPNNPTSNLLKEDAIEQILKAFNGIVVLDEAYIDFAHTPGFSEKLAHYPNLVILQTFSKAWGLAGIRLGMAFASEQIINVLNRIKYPYNINILTQKEALKQLLKVEIKEKNVEKLLMQRNLLAEKLTSLKLVTGILPSDANFLMVKMDNPKAVFSFLTDKKIIVRDRSRVALCDGYLRFTIGTQEENELLLDAIMRYETIPK